SRAEPSSTLTHSARWRSGSVNCRTVTCIFFFQAEDGIRDKLVTGVQTCALPILPSSEAQWHRIHIAARPRRYLSAVGRSASSARSEERRVGKECRSRGRQST